MIPAISHTHTHTQNQAANPGLQRNNMPAESIMLHLHDFHLVTIQMPATANFNKTNSASQICKFWCQSYKAYKERYWREIEVLTPAHFNT
jgi:hypothetical protein